MNFKFYQLNKQLVNMLQCSIAFDATVTFNATVNRKILNRILSSAFLLISIFLFSGCQTQRSLVNKKSSDLAYWQLKARIAITTGNGADSATLDWKHSAKDFDFHVYGLLGVTYAHLTQKDKLAILRLQKEQTVSAPNAQELLDNHLELKFPPINALSHWVKGMAYGHPQEVISRNDNNQITDIEFDGWLVKFSQFRDYAGKYALQKMPRIIKATHQKYGKIKIVVKKWKFLTEKFDVSA